MTYEYPANVYAIGELTNFMNGEYTDIESLVIYGQDVERWTNKLGYEYAPLSVPNHPEGYVIYGFVFYFNKKENSECKMTIHLQTDNGKLFGFSGERMYSEINYNDGIEVHYKIDPIDLDADFFANDPAGEIFLNLGYNLIDHVKNLMDDER